MPKLKAVNSFHLFCQTRGMGTATKSAGESWKSMSEGEKAEWKVKWEETRVKWLQEFSEWKAKNDGTPMMKELMDTLDKLAILRSKDSKIFFRHLLMQ